MPAVFYGPAQLAPTYELEEQIERRRRGLKHRLDSQLIATAGHVEIWHTVRQSRSDPPMWPPGLGNRLVVYRGVAASALEQVLDDGLDGEPGSRAFFGATAKDKAWKYAWTGPLAVMLLFDHARVGPSCRRGAPGQATPPGFLHTYVDEGQTIHSRFRPGAGTSHLADEQMYGFYSPGPPLAALRGIVLAGPMTVWALRLAAAGISASAGVLQYP